MSGRVSARFGQIYKDELSSLGNQVAQYQLAVRTSACHEFWEALASVATPFFKGEDGTPLAMDQGVFAELLHYKLVDETFGSDDCEDVLAAFAARKFIGSSIVASLPLFNENVADVRPEKFTSVFDTLSQLHRVPRSFGEPQELGAEQEDSKCHEHRQKFFENIVSPQDVVDFINEGLYQAIARGNEWRTILLKEYECTMMATMNYVRAGCRHTCVTWVADALPPKAPCDRGNVLDVIVVCDPHEFCPFLHTFGCCM